jgi:RNA polymerase sigma factor (sigma-70 family)
VKAAIRSVLGDKNKLRRSLNSSDILQSIMLKLHEGVPEVSLPVENGIAYLGMMARNRVIHHGRKLATQKRDPNRVSYGEEELNRVADRSPSPETVVIQKELLDAIWKAFSESERLVASERMAYKSWEEIAAKSDMKADAVRKRFQRTLQMLGRSLVEG